MKKTFNEQIKNTISEKAPQKSSNDTLFENFTGDYEPIEIDFGEPAGKEIL